MDACEQLRRDLRDALHERERELSLARRRFWLGLLGLEFVLDWEERTTVDRAVSGFLCMVRAGEVALALQELIRILTGLARAAGRGPAERVLGKVAGRMLGRVALALLVVDVVAGYVRWEEEEAGVHRRFKARVRALWEESACADARRIFAEEGVSLS